MEKVNIIIRMENFI
jgi:hypothetical protein